MPYRTQVFNVAATIMESGADIIALQGIVAGPAGRQALAMLVAVLNLFDAGMWAGADAVHALRPHSGNIVPILQVFNNPSNLLSP